MKSPLVSIHAPSLLVTLRYAGLQVSLEASQGSPKGGQGWELREIFNWVDGQASLQPVHSEQDPPWPGY